jgi:transcriptional regulator with XRE-family HTH domain
MREAREAAGLKQKDVVERTGADKGTVSKWERDTVPSDDHLSAVAALYGVSAAELRYGASRDTAAAPAATARDLGAMLNDCGASHQQRADFWAWFGRRVERAQETTREHAEIWLAGAGLLPPKSDARVIRPLRPKHS